MDRTAGRTAVPLTISCLLCLTGAILAAPVSAETVIYTLEIPESDSVTYELDIDVAHPGELTIDAAWSGSRTVSFRLEPKSRSATFRRAGPSPIQLRAEIDEAGVDDGPWRLLIHALAKRGSGSGRIHIQLPGPPAPALPPLGTDTAPPTPAEPDPWTLPRRAPAGLSPSWSQYLESVERFRAIVVEADGESPPDSCRWQGDLLRFLAEQRDERLTSAVPPPGATRNLFGEMVDVIGDVEELRNSRDPALAGPPPKNRAHRAVWERLRRERWRDPEYRLDEALESIYRGHAPQLAEEDWPVRLISCVTACQRHFEERGRLGDERATNRDLARAQWDRILAARGALAAFAQLSRSPRLAESPAPSRLSE